ncbi:MAG: M56 family metallopeptidase [Pirellulales bacterium]
MNPATWDPATWIRAVWIQTVASGSWHSSAIDVAVKATLLMALAILATWLLRRGSAALRHRVWCLTFGALVLLPILSWALPAWRIAILPPTPAQPAAAPAAAAMPEPAAAAQAATAKPEVAAVEPQRAWPQMLDGDMHAGADAMVAAGSRGVSAIEVPAGELPAAEGMPASRQWWIGATALWLGGVVLSALALGLSVVRNVSLRLNASRVTDSTWIRLRDELSQRLGLRRRVELLETDLPLVPMTWGILRSIVLVPLEARCWTDSLKRTVLLHELAHVKRFDVGFQMLARLACAIYWFHPLAWYGLRRLRIERELACDDCVLSAGERPSDYASQLLQIARNFRPVGLGAAVAMAQTNNLEGRVRALFDRARSHLPLGARSARLLLASSALIVATLAVVKPATRAADPNEPDSNAPSSEAPVAEDSVSEGQSVRGRVVGPDGNPVPEARVLVIRSYTETQSWNITSQAVSTVQCDADGSFVAEVAGRADRFASLDKFLNVGTMLVAVAEGFGADWYAVQGEDRDVVLRLVRDTVPIEGRVLDLEGRPIAGVNVSVRSISTASSDLDDWIVRARKNPTSIDLEAEMLVAPADRPTFAYFPFGKELHLEGDDIFTGVKTDKTGAFVVSGLGADRLIKLEMEGQGTAKTWLHVVTRQFQSVPLPNGDARFRVQTCFGARFETTAEPAQPIEGVVRDADTGEPLAGVEVRLYAYAESPLVAEGFLSAVTDAQGRYALAGVAKPNHPEGKNRLHVIPTGEQPYFRTEVEAPKVAGLDPVTCDVGLKRGIWIRGRAMDRGTGEPLPGVVGYYPFLDNPAPAHYANFNPGMMGVGSGDRYPTDAEGNFRIPGLPGRGIVTLIAKDAARYPIGQGVADIADLQKADANGPRLNVYHLADGGLASAIREINVLEDADEFFCQVDVPPLDKQPLLLLDPDGLPLAGVTARGLSPMRAFGAPTTPDGALPTASAELVGIGESKHRILWLTHESRKLGAMVEVMAGDFQDGQPLKIVLEPCATLSGRVVDSAGKPIQGAWGFAQAIPVRHFDDEPAYRGATATFQFQPPPWQQRVTFHRTDKNGRFQIDLLPPGITYELTIGFDRQSLKKTIPPPEAGALVDLGDLEFPASTQLSEAPGAAATQSEAVSRSNEPPAADSAAKQPSPQVVDGETINVRGQVVGPDGRPLSGIAVYRPVSKVPQPRLPGDISLERCAVSAADGRFTLSLSMRDWPTWASQMPLVAYHEAHGLAWDQVSKQPDSQEVTLKLVDDEPVRGRIVDTQGRPVAGARVHVNGIFAPKSETLDGLLTAWKQEWGQALHTMTKPLYVPLASILGATTDQAGRFELRGIGRERIAMLHVNAPATANSVLLAVTRPAFDPQRYNEAVIAQTIPDLPRPITTPVVVGPAFDHVAEPELVIEGRVYADEERTGVSGALVSATTGYSTTAAATTDATGRFELRGLPRGDERFVQIHGPVASDLLPRVVSVGVPPGESVVRLDVELKRGVVVTGRLVDRQTGNGIRGGVRFAPLPDNPYVGEPGYESYQRDRSSVVTDREGRFRRVVMPGPGILMAQAGRNTAIGDQPLNPYRQAEFSEEDRRRVPVSGSGEERYFTSAGNSREYLRRENAVKWLDGEPGKGPIECDLYVERGETVEARILDEQGEPLSGAYVAGLTESWPIAYRLQEPTCTIYALDPQQPRTVVFYHPDRLLASIVVVRGDEPGPLDVRLAPLHALTGRAVASSGAPVAKAEVHPEFTDNTASELYRLLKLDREPIRTDATGRFRLEGLGTPEK